MLDGLLLLIHIWKAQKKHRLLFSKKLHTVKSICFGGSKGVRLLVTPNVGRQQPAVFEIKCLNEKGSYKLYLFDLVKKVEYLEMPMTN